MTQIDEEPIKLRCKPDPKNSNVLFCRIIPKSLPPEKGVGRKASSETPQPDHSRTDTVKPSSYASEVAGQQEYEEFYVRKGLKDGKKIFEILEPEGNPKPKAEDISPVQTPEPDLQDPKQRLFPLKKCKGRRCSVIKQVADKNSPIKRDTTGDGGENSCKLPGTRPSPSSRQKEQACDES